MADKQSAPLNGAFYGPSIPPPQKHYHRPGRGGGCGCCGCLFSLLLKLIVSLAIIIGVAILVFWLIVHPHKVKFHVTDATLTEFNLTSNNTLHYNLALNITVRNPNKKIGIYYDKLEARAIYEGQRFAVDFLDPFYQGHKNTSVLSPSFRGEQVVVLSNKALTEFDKQKAAGSYDIDVKLYLKIRFKVGKFKTGKFKPRITCGFKIPVDGTAGAISGIGSKCDFDFR